MRIAFDTRLRRPGCVLVQAALGASVPGTLFQRHFPHETWLVSPTEDMRVYPVTEEQLVLLSRMAAASVAPPARPVSGAGGDDEPTRTSDC
jgi:hypothetical protein